MAKMKYWNGTTWEVVGTDADKVGLKDNNDLFQVNNVEDALVEIKQDFNSHMADNAPHREAVSIERKNPDDDGVFTLIEFRRFDGTFFKTSQLNGTSPYTSRIVKYYDKNGNLVQTVEYSITYSDDGEVISEVIISAE